MSYAFKKSGNDKVTESYCFTLIRNPPQHLQPNVPFVVENMRFLE